MLCMGLGGRQFFDNCTHNFYSLLSWQQSSNDDIHNLSCALSMLHSHNLPRPLARQPLLRPFLLFRLPRPLPPSSSAAPSVTSPSELSLTPPHSRSQHSVATAPMALLLLQSKFPQAATNPLTILHPMGASFRSSMAPAGMHGCAETHQVGCCALQSQGRGTWL